jgi:hypothetical protein
MVLRRHCVLLCRSRTAGRHPSLTCSPHLAWGWLELTRAVVRREPSRSDKRTESFGEILPHDVRSLGKDWYLGLLILLAEDHLAATLPLVSGSVLTRNP